MRRVPELTAEGVLGCRHHREACWQAEGTQQRAPAPPRVPPGLLGPAENQHLQPGVRSRPVRPSELLCVAAVRALERLHLTGCTAGCDSLSACTMMAAAQVAASCPSAPSCGGACRCRCASECRCHGRHRDCGRGEGRGGGGGCRCEHRPQVCADYWDSAGVAETAAASAAADGSNGTAAAAAAGDPGGGGRQRRPAALPPVGKHLEVYPTQEACCQPGFGAFARGCSLTSSLF